MKPARKVNDAGKVHKLRRSKPRRCWCQKLAYSSRKDALNQAAIARRDSGEDIRAYKCPYGHCWHIGHPPGVKEATSAESVPAPA